MTKMTDKEVADALSWLHSKEGHFNEAGKLRSHIAALTAERDEVRNGAGWGALARVEHERDALRERVKALEAESACETERGDRWKGRAETAESRLTALRKRVEEHLTSPSGEGRAVARYIIGDDAPAPSELNGLEGEMVETHTVDTMCEVEGVRILTARVAAPSTSEAFDGVRESMEACCGVHNEGGHLLSLLEHRMGAQEAALRAVIAAYDDKRAMGAPIRQARAALTDAPPVFTLEEVEKALSPWTERGLVFSQVRQRLSALRTGCAG